MMKNKVKHCTELVTNTAVTSTHCVQCVHRDVTGSIWCMKGQDNYWAQVKLLVSGVFHAHTGSHTYTEYSPVSKVTGYSKDDHHSITESEWREKPTISIYCPGLEWMESYLQDPYNVLQHDARSQGQLS
jgi:hypothetical protein